MLSINNISKTFYNGGGKTVALSNVSIDIQDNEIFGIIGLSGAGKSTLVRCINMLIKPDSGKILVDGVDVTALTKGQLVAFRKQVAMIFQNFNLFAQRKVIYNVMFPMLAHGVPRMQARQRAVQLLDKVSLSDKLDSYPSQLSGGQQQRVAIARALATNPKILLCDEATSALDNATTQSVLSLLKDINKSLGVTIIIITHQMKVIESICDRVAVMDMSQVVEIDTVENVFACPKSSVARRLTLPDDDGIHNVSTIRLVFNGQTYQQPIISSMSIATGVAVNILFANTKTIDNKTYGQLLIELPADKSSRAKLTEYLIDNDITYNILEVDNAIDNR